MSDEKVLTKEIAEQFLEDEDSVDLSEFTTIEDEAAEVIGKLRVHSFFTGSNEQQGSTRFTDLPQFKNVTEEQLTKLLPSRSELARVFVDRMSNPIEEVRQTGGLSAHLDTATAGVDALTMEWLEGGADAELLWFTNELSLGAFDALGDPLTTNTLYLQWGPLDSPRIEAYDREFKNDMMKLLSVIDLQKHLMFTGSFEDRAYFIPMELICDEILKSGWHNPILALALDLSQLSDGHLDAIMESPCDIWLGEVKSLSDEAATRLLQFQYGLTFELDQIQESAAAILRKHPSFADED